MTEENPVVPEEKKEEEAPAETVPKEE